MPYIGTAMAFRVLFYISGHGYGHARRSGQVIRALLAQNPDTQIFIRTSASKSIFGNLLPTERIEYCDVDAGAAERSPLEIDPAETLDRIAAVFARRLDIITAESTALATIRPDLLISDVPFLAGDIAEVVGVPCIAMSNFTWDWIVEPFVQNHPERRSIVGRVSESYHKMSALLRMPLGGIIDGDSGIFKNVVDVPLVANRSHRDRDEIRTLLGIAASDRRPRLLFGMRGAVPTSALAAAARSMPDVLLLCPTDEPGSLPPGVHPAQIGGTTGLDFSDLISICDVVLGKMGYGLIAECIVSGIALLWPRRTGFREDDIVEREGPRYLRMRELPLDDFRSGRWAEHVRAAIELPKPPQVMRADGAEVCARWILEQVR